MTPPSCGPSGRCERRALPLSQAATPAAGHAAVPARPWHHPRRAAWTADMASVTHPWRVRRDQGCELRNRCPLRSCPGPDDQWAARSEADIRRDSGAVVAANAAPSPGTTEPGTELVRDPTASNTRPPIDRTPSNACAGIARARPSGHCLPASTDTHATAGRSARPTAPTASFPIARPRDDRHDRTQVIPRQPIDNDHRGHRSASDHRTAQLRSGKIKRSDLRARCGGVPGRSRTPPRLNCRTMAGQFT